ncbi:glycoside hydrolase family 32 protein [Microbacterium sp. VKM Ac-2923]|uniref:glycoside hydrolase family 32 protein n=1 Tax=Microbacterium sp. VKM Ac-2923 TaxID=2929476 RepID=UPI001FB44FE0|nr:glycoside hydrolase family 32 protein [Microbacterium sp. VKM Ac-2923]MCJ1706393.1 glycoside hydrolase family 32 protein [Microbacterium sp. VKM Ac-2923]
MMGIDPRPVARSRGRRIGILITSIIAVVITVVLVIVLLPRGEEPVPEPSPSATPDAYATPEGWEQFRPTFHLTPEQHWINDPQRPVFVDGEWRLYYLYNADYPEGNGTEWHLATSTDMVTWKNRGVAIEKYRNGLGDILTGSAVVDERNTAGFGAGAIIALTTQQDDGVQRQSLFTSTDGGVTFQNYEGNPVMENPGATDWRDPKVVWDDARERWIMVLAEGERLGFYTSENLREWTYASDFVRTDYGLLECPDLFEMVDPTTGRRTWVLGVSADASATGGTTGFAYWTGAWDGERFSADTDEPQWLDGGADFYAAVTWDDPRDGDDGRLERRYALGWINNWAYARDLPGGSWQGGSLSTTREIVLREIEGRPTLLSQPVAALAAQEGTGATAPTLAVAPGETVDLPVQPRSDAYRLRAQVDAPDGGEVRLRFGSAEAEVTVGYDADAGVVFLDRRHDAVADAMPETYREIRTASVDADGSVSLDILVDASSVEVFTGDGRASLTSAAYVDARAGVTAEAVGAAVGIRNLSVTPLAVNDPNAP